MGRPLGQRGLNIMEFCKAFNAQDAEKRTGLDAAGGVYRLSDKSFSFIIKPRPQPFIKRAGGNRVGQQDPAPDKVGKITRAQAEEIAKAKMPDLTPPTSTRRCARSRQRALDGLIVEGVK